MIRRKTRKAGPYSNGLPEIPAASYPNEAGLDATCSRWNVLNMKIALISTGGTIEKTYDQYAQVLENDVSILDVLLASLELRGVELTRVALMNKDSRDMTSEDHTLIADSAGALAKEHDGVVVVHGTDRLATTGECIIARIGCPDCAVVFTGAMRPYAMKNTDATQNVTEALLAAQILAPGVYVAMHNRVLQFPGVIKDEIAGTFVRPEDD